VPDCSYRLLDELALPGMDVQRWVKHWGKGDDYKTPDEYRKNSIAVLSTHDITPFLTWWRHDTDAEEKERFLRFAGLAPSASDDEVAETALRKVNESASVFSIQLLQDWLPESVLGAAAGPGFRINFPGTTSEKNWSMVMPFTLEKLCAMTSVNRSIKQLVAVSGRLP
jgi:4-alpha-glucanotransferase